MGFFSSLWKGIKKVFKKIGKGIKKAIKGVGKFVGKLGVVGQIGMMFFMPHIAGFLSKGLSGAAKALLGVTGKGLGGTLARGLGTVLNGAHKFATTAGNVFSTVSEGVSQFAKTALNKIPGVSIEGAATDFFGNDSAWSRTLDKAGTVFDPFKGAGTSFGNKSLAEFSNSTGISQENLMTLNPELQGLKPDSIVPEGIYSTDVSLIKGIEAGIAQGQVMGQVGQTAAGLRTPTPTPAVSDVFDPDYYSQFPSHSPTPENKTEPVVETVAAATTSPSLLSTTTASLRKRFETDPLGVSQQVFDLAGRVGQLSYEEPETFIGGGAQLGSLYEPSLGYQPQQAPLLDPSQGIYGHSAFAGGNAYDLSQYSPYFLYLQQQERYAA